MVKPNVGGVLGLINAAASRAVRELRPRLTPRRLAVRHFSGAVVVRPFLLGVAEREGVSPS